MNKASGGDGIQAELFKIIKDGESAALNMPANLENLWWSWDWKMTVFIPIPKKGNFKELLYNCIHFTW